MASTKVNLRVLFVDDSDDDIRLERQELVREGLAFDWRSAASEADLVRELSEFAPHVVLCDYEIPGFSGRAALRIVKERAPGLPLIFVSGTIGEETAVECLREGAIDYVFKNNPRRLGSAVRRALAEVEERREYEDRIRHLANFDALTELPNRTLLRDRVEQAIVHAARTHGQVALLVINIDGFRRINEGLGHAVGDAVLREVASRLQASVRPGDTVARIGGDEFATLLADLRTDEANLFAWRLLETIKAPLEAERHAFSMSASGGVALYPADGADAETLLRAAMAALHRAKQTQRSGFLMAGSASDMRDSLQRVMIESALTQAVQRRELRMVYQLQYDIASGRPCGLEALIRWGRGNRAVSPEIFIPVAEETGLIREIGRWALSEACSQARAWVESPGADLTLGVNVSPLQLNDRDFAADVGRILAETGFPAHRLEMELTETSIMKGDRDVLEVVESLRRIGVKVAIDDFGTGYSSLSYLSRLPIERLKIDASFVQRMSVDPRDAKIAQSIVSLGHGLGLKVIAEGVESAEQLEMLRRMECDQAQGFLLAKPATPEEVDALLRS